MARLPASLPCAGGCQPDKCETIIHESKGKRTINSRSGSKSKLREHGHENVDDRAWKAILMNHNRVGSAYYL